MDNTPSTSAGASSQSTKTGNSGGSSIKGVIHDIGDAIRGKNDDIPTKSSGASTQDEGVARKGGAAHVEKQTNSGNETIGTDSSNPADVSAAGMTGGSLDTGTIGPSTAREDVGNING